MSGHDGCDCTELCSMGPTCPGGGLAGLSGAGCWRTKPLKPVPVPFGVVAPFAAVAAREGVSVKDSTDGDLWVAVVHPTAGVIAFGALHRRYRIKATWTRPDFRGDGYGSAIVTELLRHRDPAGRPAQVIARDPSWWLSRGWTAITTRPNGGTVLEAKEIP